RPRPRGPVRGGTAGGGGRGGIMAAPRAPARRSRLDLLAGVQGTRLVVVLGGSADPLAAAQQLIGRFGPGPVVVGHAVPDLQSAAPSAAAAVAGFRAAAAWPDAPRPVLAAVLLPGRAQGRADAARAD